VWGPAGLAYSVESSSGDVEVIHADHLGSPRVTTDAGGDVVATARYDEFGILLDATGASDAPFGFTGEPADPTGLVHLRARSYDPALGRFLNRDPWPGVAHLPTSLNRYTYVANNPLRYADPSGECLIDTVADVGFILWSGITFLTSSEKERDENLAALGLDVAGLAIPCGAGLGTASRVLRAADNALTFTPRLGQQALEHIVERHWYSSIRDGVSRFGSDVVGSVNDLRSLIGQAAGRGAWRQEGTTQILEADMGRTVGTDMFGSPTNWIRIVVDGAGDVITAYPIHQP
jgi:RHS repeat-associated protein